MEQKSTTIVKNVNNNLKMKDQNLLAPKKKRGAMHIIKVALFMLRRSGKSKSPVQVDLYSNGSLNKFLGSMRPLHLQSDQYPHPLDGQAVAPPSTIEHYEEAFSPPMSPAGAKSLASSSSVDNLSQYASALNLQELDTSEENNEVYDIDGGDEMIDAKAEEFINQFYAQMKIQRSEYVSSFNGQND